MFGLFRRKGPSGFLYSSTAEDVTPGIDGTGLAAIVTDSLVSWVPPLVGWLKINADGSRAEDRFGYGAIIRNHKGECLTAIAARVRAASINILELKGLVHGLLLCSSLCASHVWLESDSTTAIAWIRGNGNIPWTALRDLRTFSTLSSQLIEWKATHVYREGNKAADLLAAAQSPLGCTIYDPQAPGYELAQIIHEDKVGTVTLRK